VLVTTAYLNTLRLFGLKSDCRVSIWFETLVLAVSLVLNMFWNQNLSVT